MYSSDNAERDLGIIFKGESPMQDVHVSFASLPWSTVCDDDCVDVHQYKLYKAAAIELTKRNLHKLVETLLLL
jgi:hypothetical protein